MLDCIEIAPRPAALAEPSALLTFLAGEFAPRIARQWPDPHAVFMTAPAARRHLVCLALALEEAPGLETMLHAPMQRAIGHLAAPRPPPGLARALGRLGEVAWAAADYRRLFDRLADLHAGKVLRHAERIDAEHVRVLSLLSESLLRGGVGRLGLNADQATILVEAAQLIVDQRGEAGCALVSRWAAATTLNSLFELIRDDIDPEPPAPPSLSDERFLPLASKAALRDAAIRYSNCLRREIHNAVGGWSAYYEWQGDPGAVIEIYRDPLFGWRLEQARLAKNKPVLGHMRLEIVEALKSSGIHVGRTSWGLRNALEAAAKPGFKLETLDASIGYLCGDDDDE